MNLYHKIKNKFKDGEKQFAILLDPDKQNATKLAILVENANMANVDYFLVGGSLLVNDSLDTTIEFIKEHSSIPTILFPGSIYQLNNKVDGILFLSLISGRNSQLLIGDHVHAAPYLYNSEIEVISTGYMLIDGGAPSSVSYMSNTTPIPHNKNDIARATAMAGQFLGLKLLYLDTGSGAKKTVSNEMISAVSDCTNIPLIVGGGIKSPEVAYEKARSGANLIVVGNALETDPSLLREISAAVYSAKVKTASV